MDFRKVAQEKTLLAGIMVGRRKLDTKEVIERDLTIIGFDFAPKFDANGEPVVNTETGEPDTFGVVIFSEIPDAYYCVGTVFTKVCKAWAAEFDSTEESSRELAESGGVKVRFHESKTKKGNNLTSVEIL